MSSSYNSWIGITVGVVYCDGEWKVALQSSSDGFKISIPTNYARFLADQLLLSANHIDPVEE